MDIIYIYTHRSIIYLDPAEVRRNDTSAVSINEWTGERLNAEFAPDVQPQVVNALGNYAAQILWEDGFNQVRGVCVCG